MDIAGGTLASTRAPPWLLAPSVGIRRARGSLPEGGALSLIPVELCASRSDDNPPASGLVLVPAGWRVVISQGWVGEPQAAVNRG